MPSAHASKRGAPEPQAVAKALLSWYDAAARRLPWRVPPGGGRADPYRVWLSEIMLQQTTVAAVIPYFEAFLARWPTVEALARAPQEEVLDAWAGLGYYSRARNLHAAARVVAEELGGHFPQTTEGLLALPGIGPYTAAAIAAIAFDVPATVVDGNVERVTARLFSIETPLPAGKPEIRAAAARLTPSARPGDFAQAMMDLGAGLCSPRAPSCLVCPVGSQCVAAARGIADRLPARAPKADKPTRRALAFLCLRSDGALLLRRRPPRGLLGGMLEVPSSPWEAGPFDPDAARAHAPAPADWRVRTGLVRHTFTHFHLELMVAEGRISAAAATTIPGALWCAPEALAEAGLPSVMRKVTDLLDG
ncbi:MAG: A/G-specific adenine glycosylase [Alphaproteobacteria bacterium]|nr:A/G-specific adenine glycosylase [Alphaproteobacteria bacterium]